MLGEILRRREVRAVTWFHADHWEPWAGGINDVTLRRVDSFLKQAKQSPFANKMTLFYLAGTVYGLNPEAGGADDEIIRASPRSVLESEQVREILGKLRDVTDVEFQVHLHHEHLVGNDGDWDEIHRVVKGRTDPQQDERRLHYLLRTELAIQRHDTGAPLDRWAFVHGMWALNGSDRAVCQIDNEIEILMEHGCWGDFTFPAARYHCDPTILEQPYTCRPFKAPKAYDDRRGEPMAVDVGAGAIRDGRFLIWNSRAKHNVCSLDHYDPSDLSRVRQADNIVSSWLANCPVIDNVLYVKTHAHSMEASYYDDGNRIPLASPNIEPIWARLQRACQEANVELKLATVDEVCGTLRELDNRADALPRIAASSAISAVELQTMPLQAGAQQDASATFSMVNLAAVSTLQDWLGSDPGRIRSAGSYYTARLEKGRLFVDSELSIAEYSRRRFSRKVRFFELGFGFGELSLLLALSGFRATGFESDEGRHAGATALMAKLAQRGIDVDELSLVKGSFPDALQLATFDKDGETVFVSTNVTSSQVMEKIDYVYRSLRLFDHLIIDLSRFGQVRNEQSQHELIVKLRECGFMEVASVYSNGETDVRHFEREPTGAKDANILSAPAVVEELRYSDLGNPVPRRFLRAPFHVFQGNEVPIEAVLPRLLHVPRSWLPPAPIRIAAVPSAFGRGAVDAAPGFREGPEPGTGSFVFDQFGGHRVNCSYGVFKCLTLDPKVGRDQQALEIFRFAAENIIHSCIDKHVILPWAKRPQYVRPDLLLAKLFQSDQPLGLHCDHAAEVTSYLLHLSGYQVREVSIIDPALNSGHVVMEVFLPEQARWVMLDPDYGVVVSDHAGKLMSTAELVASVDRERDLEVRRIVEKQWVSGSYNVAEAHSGQLTFPPGESVGSPTVEGKSYFEVLNRCFRARRVFAHRNFEDSFENNRLDGPLEAASDIALNGKSAEQKDAGQPAVLPDTGSMSASTIEEDNAMRDVVSFDPFKMFKSYFKLAGTVRLDACPVCESGRITQIWQLPQSRLDGKTFLSAPGSAHNNTYLDYLPLLKVPQEIFGFDICADCHSIFRNPKDDDQETYKRDTSKVRSFKEQGLDPFRGAAQTCEAYFPSDTRFVVDAACGSGQILAIYKEKRPELRLFGLELSAPSIDWMKSIGIDGAVTDLDFDDLDGHVAPGTVDFIIFNEAFEHVRSPLRVLRKMFRMLRVGGRIHFTAQYFGPENGLQIRVGEPIYIDRHGLDWVIGQLDARLIELKADIKFRVTLEKKA